VWTTKLQIYQYKFQYKFLYRCQHKFNSNSCTASWPIQSQTWVMLFCTVCSGLLLLPRFAQDAWRCSNSENAVAGRQTSWWGQAACCCILDGMKELPESDCLSRQVAYHSTDRSPTQSDWKQRKECSYRDCAGHAAGRPSACQPLYISSRQDRAFVADASQWTISECGRLIHISCLSISPLLVVLYISRH